MHVEAPKLELNKNMLQYFLNTDKQASKCEIKHCIESRLRKCEHPSAPVTGLQEQAVPRKLAGVRGNLTSQGACEEFTRVGLKKKNCSKRRLAKAA